MFGVNKNDFGKYIELLSKIKEQGLTEKWEQIKKDEGIELDYPSTLNPRIEKMLEDKTPQKKSKKVTKWKN